MKKEVDVFETELNDISENHCFRKYEYLYLFTSKFKEYPLVILL